jgi:hypothetical protein
VAWPSGFVLFFTSCACILQQKAIKSKLRAQKQAASVLVQSETETAGILLAQHDPPRAAAPIHPGYPALHQ